MPAINGRISKIESLLTLRQHLKTEHAQAPDSDHGQQLALLQKEVDNHILNLEAIEGLWLCADVAPDPHAVILHALQDLPGCPLSQTLSPALVAYLEPLPAQLAEELQQVKAQLATTSGKNERQALNSRRRFLQLLLLDLQFVPTYARDMQALQQLAEERRPLADGWALLTTAVSPV